MDTYLDENSELVSWATKPGHGQLLEGNGLQCWKLAIYHPMTGQESFLRLGFPVDFPFRPPQVNYGISNLLCGESVLLSIDGILFSEFII